VSAGCETDHCVTCSDEAVPVCVVQAREDGIAICADATGAASEVMTDLVGTVTPGDALLVHAGVAIARLP
jgi:hydrogenase maturation factor